MSRWSLDWRQDWRQEWRGLDEDTAVFPGYGPSGAASFALDLRNGYQVAYRWPTSIIKKRSGKEQRISRNDHPKESYSGTALMFDDLPATVRATLARYAAIGSAFLIGLPHEELTLTASASGATVYVTTTTYSDWLNTGQRVMVVREGLHVDAVVQSKTWTSITLDVSPGVIGDVGGVIMPAMPVYLEPEQAFPRYPVHAEEWSINARAAIFDFAPTLASLPLDALTVSAAFDNVTIVARNVGIPVYFGLDGNAAHPSAGLLVEADGEVQFNFKPGVTTLGNLKTALDASVYVNMIGTWTSTDTIAAGDSFALGVQLLTGGTTAGLIGTGASVTTYVSRPVWTPPIVNRATNTDSIQSLAEIVDFDGVPYAVGSADIADWGRAIVYESAGLADWQWLKLFMATVKGPQKAFWLPTWRDDLPFVSKSTNTITVEGDVSAWYPLQRQHVQIVETSGTITRAQITAATDNGNGTWTLTIGTTLASSSVDLVSWLELARFTGDTFTVTFDEHGFSLATVATVVQQ